jgi:hypothetical protein
MSSKKLDIDRVQSLVDRLEAAIGASIYTETVKYLKQREGLRITGDDHGVVVTMARIEGKARQGTPEALTNWCNAARRAIRKAQAA